MNQVSLDNSMHEVLIEKRGSLGHIVLNRPHALNALTLDMIRQIASALKDWESDGTINAVLFSSSSEKAFCAGGDVKSFYHAGMDSKRGHASSRVPMVFFGEEYSLNKQIFDYRKPTYAIIDGICMGGGYGIAGHSNVRIASSRAVFAMPETAIGFFPDVGAIYHLLNCPKHFGRYLALSGDHIDGEEMVAVGLADFYVPQIDTELLVNALSKVKSEEERAELLMQMLSIQKAKMPTRAAITEEAFSSTDLSEILDRLEALGSSEAADIFETLNMRSPTSVMVTAEYLKWAEGKDFDEIIAQDFVLAQHFTAQQDLYEGIRAKIIDKDNSPNWLPGDFKELDQETINAYFTGTEYDLKDVEIF